MKKKLIIAEQKQILKKGIEKMYDENKYLNEGKKVFKYRFISNMSTLVLLIISFPIALIVNNHTNADFAIFTLIVIIACAFIIPLILNLKFWKCPKCEKNFKFRHGAMDDITHCPYCGVRLRYLN